MKGNSKGIIGFAMLATVLISCTEKRDYDTLYKGDLKLQSKSEICSDEEYLYLPSTVEASRTTTATRPHWMGEAKRVRLECPSTKFALSKLIPKKSGTAIQQINCLF